MSKPDPNTVVPEMRHRLEVNRSGKLTSGQWLDIVLQPLAPMLLILLPGGLILLPRLLFVMVRGGWLLLIVLLAFLVWAFVARARRYARAPLQYAELRAEGEAPLWGFWRPVAMKDPSGTPFRFTKRLAPRPLMKRGHNYLVYYLREGDEYVLLSLAPADHEDVARWLPDRSFYARQERRGGANA